MADAIKYTLKPGDLVKLKSGGPKMTVMEIDEIAALGVGGKTSRSLQVRVVHASGRFKVEKLPVYCPGEVRSGNKRSLIFRPFAANSSYLTL
jgi:hypothetical protein